MTSMSPMAQMSQGIRMVSERFAPTLKEIPTDVLEQFVTIVGAFYVDMDEELARRQSSGRGGEAPPRVASRAQTPAGVSPENPPGGPPRSIKRDLDEFVETPERLVRAVFNLEDVP